MDGSNVTDVVDNVSNVTTAAASLYNGLTPQQKSWLYMFIVPSMVFLCTVAATVNCYYFLVALKWVTWRGFQKPTLCFCISLAAADAYAATVIGVGLIVNSLLPSMNIMKANPCVTLTLEVFRLGGMITSVLHLLGLAINHYIGILRPFQYSRVVTVQNVWKVVAAAWLFPIIMNIVYFASVPGEGYQSSNCTTDFMYDMHFRAFTGAVFFLPLIIMIFIYMHIVLIINSPDFALTQYHRSLHYRTRLRAIVTTLLFLGSYIVGWMPAVMFFVLTCDNCIRPVASINQMTTLITTTIINSLIVLKSLVDAILYTSRIRELREAVRKMHSRCLRRKRSSLQVATEVALVNQDPFNVNRLLHRATYVHYKHGSREKRVVELSSGPHICYREKGNDTTF